ncbi:MAG: sigma-70 family RNA polymerase sigma factor [Chitinophagaceae bacterium]|jgi:RNA polymerase sigma-70 factor (ECF subfamily)|nr:MAG: sigma-70 family RNA polymerase sigma factor [Chitinophagaceae bacterium]
MEPSQTLEAITDTEAIQRILNGETRLYEIIVRRYNAYLFKVGRSYGYNHADTEDLMQETYVNAYIHLKDFENRSSFKTWIVKIMLNQCYHKKQKFSYQKEISVENNLEDKSVPMFSDPHSDTGKTVTNTELKHVLEDAVQHIPEDYRTVFTLRELNGMSVNETAEALHITESNVKVRLNRAKGMLRKEIRKTYSPGEIFEFNLIYCDGMVDRVMKAIEQIKADENHEK